MALHVVFLILPTRFFSSFVFCQCPRHYWQHGAAPASYVQSRGQRSQEYGGDKEDQLFHKEDTDEHQPSSRAGICSFAQREPEGALPEPYKTTSSTGMKSSEQLSDPTLVQWALGSSWRRIMPGLMWLECIGHSWLAKALMPLTGFCSPDLVPVERHVSVHPTTPSTATDCLTLTDALIQVWQGIPFKLQLQLQTLFMPL